MHTKHPNLVKIGKRIQELRKKTGYSQEGFAYEAGIALLILEEFNVVSKIYQYKT